MPTSYKNEISSLIASLMFTKEQNLNNEENRHHAANLLFGAHKTISAIEEKELSTLLLNTSGDLDLQWVLEKDHPDYEQDAVDFKNHLESIIGFLKNID